MPLRAIWLMMALPALFVPCVLALYTDGYWCVLYYTGCESDDDGTNATCCRWRGEF